VKDWEGSGGGAEGRESKRERDRTKRENFTVIVWEGSGGGAGGRERKRDRIKRESKRASLHLWRNGVTIGPSMLLRGTFGYCVLLHE